MIFVVILQMLANFFSSWILAQVIQKYLLNVKQNIVDKYIKSFSDTQENIQTILNSDFEKLGDDIQLFLVTMVQSTLMLTLYIVMLFSLNIKLTISVLAFIPLVLVVNFKFGNLIQKQYQNIQGDLDEVNLNIQNTTNNKILIKAFRANDFITTVFMKNSKKLSKDNIWFDSLSSFMESSLALISVVVPFVLLLFGSYFVLHNVMSVGDLLAMFTFSSTIFVPISGLMGLIPLKQEIKISKDRINNFSSDLVILKSQKLKSHSKDTITFRNLKIGYANKEFDRTFSGNIHQGLTIITGENDIGKSTLAKTLASIIPAKSGTFWGNKDIMYLASDEFLLSGTVMDNMTVGLKSVNLNALNKFKNILNLKLNINETVIDKSLSLGEIQKIKIVRALLDEKNIVIFDEVLSNLDDRSQKKLYDFFSTCKDRTFIVIDHNTPKEFMKFEVKISEFLDS